MSDSEAQTTDDGCVRLKIERLLAWCSMNEVFISPDLQLHNDHCGGIGVFSRCTTIDPLKILVKIKKTSVLSVRSNTESSSGVMDAIPYGLDAQLELAAVLYVEILKGAKSRWHGYLQSLPQQVDLPLFWMIDKDRNEDASESITWLRGTEAKKLLLTRGETRQLLWEEIAAFYDNIAAPRISSIDGRWEFESGEPSLQGFFYAFSLVSSRAFVVDAYQGLAMVPIADIFNHALDHHVHLETEFDVCPLCGSYRQCDHDWELKGHNSSIRDGDERDDQEDDLYYEMVANAAIPPHAEVFNTYGEDLSNAQLLNRYGFVLDINENDRISWTLDDIFLLFPGISPDVRRQLALFLQKPLPEISADIRDFLPLSELLYLDHNPFDAFFVESDAKCSLQLWIAVVCLLLYEADPGKFLTDYSDENQLYHRVQSTLRLQLRLEGVYGSEAQGGELSPCGLSEPSDSGLLSQVAYRIAELCEARRRNTGKEGTSDMSLFDMLDDQNIDVGPRTRMAISIVATERTILESCELRWVDVAVGSY